MATIETAVSGTVIFASSTGNHYIITLDHVGVFLTTRSTSLVQKAGGHESRHRQAPSRVLYVVSQSNSVHAGCLFPLSFRTRDRHRDAHIFPFYEIALLFLSLQQALAFMDVGFGR